MSADLAERRRTSGVRSELVFAPQTSATLCLKVCVALVDCLDVKLVMSLKWSWSTCTMNIGLLDEKIKCILRYCTNS